MFAEAALIDVEFATNGARMISAPSLGCKANRGLIWYTYFQVSKVRKPIRRFEKKFQKLYLEPLMRSDPCVHTSCAPLGPRQKCKASGKLDSNSDWDHPPMPYAVKIINNYRLVKCQPNCARKGKFCIAQKNIYKKRVARLMLLSQLVQDHSSTEKKTTRSS